MKYLVFIVNNKKDKCTEKFFYNCAIDDMYPSKVKKAVNYCVSTIKKICEDPKHPLVKGDIKIDIIPYKKIGPNINEYRFIEPMSDMVIFGEFVYKDPSYPVLDRTKFQTGGAYLSGAAKYNKQKKE